MTLFERVKSAADSRGYTLAELSRKAGIGEKSIYAWRPSKNYPEGIHPKKATLQKIADVLGVSVDYLLGNTDEMYPKQTNASAEDADLKKYFDENIPLQFDGREIPQEDLKIIKRILESMDDE